MSTDQIRGTKTDANSRAGSMGAAVRRRQRGEYAKAPSAPTDEELAEMEEKRARALREALECGHTWHELGENVCSLRKGHDGPHEAPTGAVIFNLAT